ncbi:FAD binding domain-containing protein [Streptomyces sp. NPDC006134]|uniref:FAD binding domain-containing protein n=1 Tax=Streptomyces sp. NPDC006134 TaxID=3154467 RepID=UPI0033CCC748
MDLASVREVVDARCALPWTCGDAWLAGGTSLFAEPGPGIVRLRDLTALGWKPLAATGEGLEVAATCTVAELLSFAETPDAPWPQGRALIAACCRAFSSSFKVWNVATVGGNLCAALPAGPMISLAVTLRGHCRVQAPDGGERHIPAADFVTGAGTTALRPGELLRSVTLPAAALGERSALRQVSLRPLGRSAALVTGTCEAAARHLAVTVTAATRRPVTLTFSGPPSAARLRRELLEHLPTGLIADDVHGCPAWRRQMALHLADEVLRDLTAGEV